MLFSGLPEYWRYRTLRLTSPHMHGEDVYALQTALASLGNGVDPGAADGYLGPRTAEAIKRAQQMLLITVDGLCGGGTQTAICDHYAKRVSGTRIPFGLVFGQVMHESSCRLGNYSEPHSMNVEGGPYYDAGPTQRNTRYTSAKEGFNVPKSFDKLAEVLRVSHANYAGIAHRRRWELAAGSWNAPAYANYIAREEGATIPRSETSMPSETARRLLEEYMDSATAFMKS